jgi:hypothetical protein
LQYLYNDVFTTFISKIDKRISWQIVSKDRFAIPINYNGDVNVGYAISKTGFVISNFEMASPKLNLSFSTLDLASPKLDLAFPLITEGEIRVELIANSEAVTNSGSEQVTASL